MRFSVRANEPHNQSGSEGEMATATVIDFVSLMSPSGDERIQSTFESCMDLKEVVDSTCDQNADEFGIVGSSSVLRAVLDNCGLSRPLTLRCSLKAKPVQAR